MITNTTSAADQLREIGRELDPKLSQTILVELFETWVCSEALEDTDKKYRRDVLFTVNALQQLIVLSQSREVDHD